MNRERPWTDYLVEDNSSVDLGGVFSQSFENCLELVVSPTDLVDASAQKADSGIAKNNQTINGSPLEEKDKYEGGILTYAIPAVIVGVAVYVLVRTIQEK